MYFAVIGTDRAGAEIVRNTYRPAHRERLRNPGKHSVAVLHGGPLLNQLGVMNGTLLIVEASSYADVEKFMAEDPYCTHQLFDRLEIREWMWSLGGPQSQNFEIVKS